MAQPEGRHQLHRLCRPDAGNISDLVYRASAQAVQRLITLQELSGDVDGVRTRQSRSEKNRDQLRVGEGAGAARHQFLPRTIVLRHFVNL